MEFRSLISNNLHLSVRSSMSCGVLIFVSSFPCVGQWLDARHDATICGEKCFGTFDRTPINRKPGIKDRTITVARNNTPTGKPLKGFHSKIKYSVNFESFETKNIESI